MDDVPNYALLPDRDARAFAIDETSGAKRVAHAIDAETLETLRLVLRVTASDGRAPTAHTATATVLVHVVDVDEHLPTISIGPDDSTTAAGPHVGTPQPIRVRSSAPSGTPLANITLSDRDKEPSDFRCDLNDTRNFKLERRPAAAANATSKRLYSALFYATTRGLK